MAAAMSVASLNLCAQDAAAPPIIDKAGEQAALDAGKAFAKGATNVASWDVATYGTYFPDGKKNGVGTTGGGVYVQYKIKGSEFFSAGLGLDYMSGGTRGKGNLEMPSGSVTAKYPIDVGRYVGFSTGKIVFTPIAFAGIATPLSGAGKDNLGIAGLAGAGGFVSLPQFSIKSKAIRLSLGYAGIKWLNAGPYSGMHHELFANFNF